MGLDESVVVGRRGIWKIIGSGAGVGVGTLRSMVFWGFLASSFLGFFVSKLLCSKAFRFQSFLVGSKFLGFTPFTNFFKILVFEHVDIYQN